MVIHYSLWFHWIDLMSFVTDIVQRNRLLRGIDFIFDFFFFFEFISLWWMNNKSLLITKRKISILIKNYMHLLELISCIKLDFFQKKNDVCGLSFLKGCASKNFEAKKMKWKQIKVEYYPVENKQICNQNWFIVLIATNSLNSVIFVWKSTSAHSSWKWTKHWNINEQRKNDARTNRADRCQNYTI